MPLFTAENARANAQKSAQVRRQRRERLRNPPPIPALAPHMPDELARDAIVLRQLKKVDEFMEQCRDGALFVKLTRAKGDLWNLIYPKAGVLRHLLARNRPEVPTINPQDWTPIQK